MTTPDTKAIKAQMEALSGFAPGPWKVSPTDDTNVITHDREMVAEIAGDYNDPDLWPIMEADTRLIAAAPDMRETILALCDALDELRAENDKLRAMIRVNAIRYLNMSHEDIDAAIRAALSSTGEKG